MVEYKQYVKDLFVGKKVHFKCDCMLSLDVTGIVSWVEQIGSEIVFVVESNGKYVKVGENTHGLKIQFL